MPQGLQIQPIGQGLDIQPLDIQPVDKPRTDGPLSHLVTGEPEPKKWWQLPFTSFNELLGVDQKVKGGITDLPGAIWDIGKHALTDPSSILPMMRGFGQGAVEGAGSFAPIDALDLATGFGKSNLVRGANQVISGLTAGHGASEIVDNPLTGTAEMLGGAIGLRPGTRPKVPEPPRIPGDRLLTETAGVSPDGYVPTETGFERVVNPPSVEPELVIPEIVSDVPLQIGGRPEPAGLLPARGETGIAAGTDPSFYQGAVGTADARLNYPVDLTQQHRLSPGATSNPEMELGSISPSDAAQYGVGSIINPVDPITLHPTFNALLPDVLKPTTSTPILPTPVARSLPDVEVKQRYPEGGKVTRTRPQLKREPTDDPKLDRLLVREAKQIDPNAERPRAVNQPEIIEGEVVPVAKPNDNPNRFDVTNRTLNPDAAHVYKSVPDVNKNPATEKLSAAVFSSLPLNRMGRKYTGGVGQPLKLNEADVKGIYQTLKDAPNLTAGERISAQRGLGHLLDPNAMKVPGKMELAALRKAFGDEFANVVRSRQTLGGRAKEMVIEGFNYPRAIMSTMDFSAPFRQGLPLVHKKEFWGSFGDMVRSAGSEKAYQAAQEAIHRNPNYQLAERSGLQLTDLEGLTNREEKFMSTWAEKIPGVRASNRAYTAFLNKLRMDTFDSLIRDANLSGMPEAESGMVSRELAKFVNNATGRGGLGPLERNAELLNATLFSPRLQASRIGLVGNLMSPEPMVRQEALKSFLAMGAFGGTLAGVAAAIPGVEVGTDTTSSDFGKIRVGNVRIDPYAGFQQYGVYMSKLAQGKTTSPVSGETREFNENYVSPDRGTTTQDFWLNKAHPVAGLIWTLFKGRDRSGQDPNIPNEVMERMVPIIMQDLRELYNEDPRLVPVGLLPFIGIGVQTFEGVGRRDR